MTFERILVRGVNWIGDAVIATPAIRALRRAWPEARIVVQCRPWVAPVYEDNPDVDDLICVDDKASKRAWLSSVGQVRRGKFDLGVLLPNSFGTALAMRLAGVKRRYGYARDGRGWLLSDPQPVTDSILKSHQVDYYLNIVREIVDFDGAERKLVLSARDETRESVAKLLEEHGIGPDEPIIGLNPGAAFGTAKRWLPKRYAELADRLIEERGVKIVVTGSPSEADVGLHIAGLAERPIVNLAGKISLGELIALMERLDLYVTNDSGAMHIAAAIETSIVAIFGSTDWITTSPYSDKAVIVRKDTDCAPCLLRDCPTDHVCMTKIEVEDVMEGIESLCPANG